MSRRKKRRNLGGGKFLGLCLVTGGLSLYMGVQAGIPACTLARWRASNNRIQREVLAYKLQNQRLRTRIRALGSSYGVENSARALGYVKQGERPLQTVGM